MNYRELYETEMAATLERALAFEGKALDVSAKVASNILDRMVRAENYALEGDFRSAYYVLR